MEEGTGGPVVEEGMVGPVMEEGDGVPVVEEGAGGSVVEEGDGGPVVEEGDGVPVVEEGEGVGVEEGDGVPMVEEGEGVPVVEEGAGGTLEDEVQAAVVLEGVGGAEGGREGVGVEEGRLNELRNAVGLTGPLEMLGVTVVLSCVYIAICVVVVEVLPTLLGRVLLNVLGIPTWLVPRLLDGVRAVLLPPGTDLGNRTAIADGIISLQGLRDHLDVGMPLPVYFHHMRREALSPEYITLRLVVLLESLCGYSILLAVLVLGLVGLGAEWNVRTSLSRRLRGRIEECWKSLQIAAYMFVEFALVPQLLGWILDIVTLKTLGAELSDRIVLLQERPLLFLAVHLFAGLFLAMHVSLVMAEARGILKENVLTRLLPEDLFFADDTSLEAIGGESWAVLLERLLLNVCYYVLHILLMVMAPVKIGHLFVPFATPLRLSFETFSPDVQLPLELIVLHFLFPLLFRKYNHRAFMRYLLHGVIVRACDLLGLREDLLDSEVVRETLGPSDVMAGGAAAGRDQHPRHDNLDDRHLEALATMVAGGLPAPVLAGENLAEQQQPHQGEPQADVMDAPVIEPLGEVEIDAELVREPGGDLLDPAGVTVEEHLSGQSSDAAEREGGGGERASILAHLIESTDSITHTPHDHQRDFERSPCCKKTLQYIALILVVMIAIVVIFSWMVHLPFLLGRYFLRISGCVQCDCCFC